MKIGILAAAAIAFAGTGAGSAFAQDEDLHAEVKSIISESTMPSDVLVGKMRSGELEEGEADIIRFQIDSRKSYWVRGACDFDCYDVDLAIVDGNDDDIDSDYEDDDAPIVAVEPDESGDELRVRIDMEGCEAEFCVWAVAIYEKQ